MNPAQKKQGTHEAPLPPRTHPDGTPVNAPYEILSATSFDPAALLFRLREQNPLRPLIHIDRERTTGWSHIPVRISRILSEGPGGLIWYGEEGEALSQGPGGWGQNPLLDRPLALAPLLREEGSLPPSGPSLPPFSSGVVLLLPFEMAETWEPSGGPFAGPQVPAILVSCSGVVSYHAPTGRLFLPPGFDKRLLEPVSFAPPPPVRLVPSLSSEGFSELFCLIRAGLERGDYFQVNIAQRFDAEIPAGFDPLSAYARLLSRSRSRYGGFFSFREHFLLSHSPEQLLALSGDLVRTRPIAGTAPGVPPKGRPDPLLADPKLLAEHIMTVDLLRNDIGRVSRAGTVEVPALLAIESYPHLRHLVSEVSGRIDPRLSRGEVIRSLFPGGSVTGAPRIRVRREIGDLEGVPRNYYCGALGFLSEAGEMDMALLIRTLEGVREGAGGRLVFGAGAGIVADSREEEEFAEILLKARAMGEVLS